MYRQNKSFNISKEQNTSSNDLHMNLTQRYSNLKESQVVQISNTTQTLNPNFISAMKPKTSRTKGGQRLKLIDYISLKNTAKQYGTHDKKSKIDVDLRKSQMKDNKAKAFNLFVKEMEKEFDIIEAIIPQLKKQVGQNITSDGNTSDIAKVCAIRRILKQKMLGAIQEIRKLNGTQGKSELKITRKLTAQQQQDELDNKLAQLGLSRIISQTNLIQERCENDQYKKGEEIKVTINGR